MTTGVGSFKSYQLSEGRTTPVPNRVSPTDRIRAEIDALFDGSRELGEVIEEVARLGARLIIQTAVEAEVEVFLGRVKVIGRFPGETSCLNLVWAVLDRASRGWRGVNTTKAGLRLLHDLRRQLLDPPTPIHRTSHPDAEPEQTVAAIA